MVEILVKTLPQAALMLSAVAGLSERARLPFEANEKLQEKLGIEPNFAIDLRPTIGLIK